jgi:hypothetical protein
MDIVAERANAYFKGHFRVSLETFQSWSSLEILFNPLKIIR